MPNIEWVSTLDNSSFLDSVNTMQNSIHELKVLVEKAGVDIDAVFKKFGSSSNISFGTQGLEEQVNKTVDAFQRIVTALGASSEAAEDAKRRLLENLMEITTSSDDAATKQERLSAAIQTIFQDLSNEISPVQTLQALLDTFNAASSAASTATVVNATAHGAAAVAVGAEAGAHGVNTVSIGKETEALGENTTALEKQKQESKDAFDTNNLSEYDRYIYNVNAELAGLRERLTQIQALRAKQPENASLALSEELTRKEISYGEQKLSQAQLIKDTYKSEEEVIQQILRTWQDVVDTQKQISDLQSDLNNPEKKLSPAQRADTEQEIKALTDQMERQQILADALQGVYGITEKTIKKYKSGVKDATDAEKEKIDSSRQLSEQEKEAERVIEQVNEKLKARDELNRNSGDKDFINYNNVETLKSANALIDKHIESLGRQKQELEAQQSTLDKESDAYKEKQTAIDNTTTAINTLVAAQGRLNETGGATIEQKRTAAVNETTEALKRKGQVESDTNEKAKRSVSEIEAELKKLQEQYNSFFGSNPLSRWFKEGEFEAYAKSGLVPQESIDNVNTLRDRIKELKEELKEAKKEASDTTPTANASALNTLLDEQKEKQERLKNLLKEYEAEYDKLANKENLSNGDEKRLSELSGQIRNLKGDIQETSNTIREIRAQSATGRARNWFDDQIEKVEQFSQKLKNSAGSGIDSLKQKFNDTTFGQKFNETYNSISLNAKQASEAVADFGSKIGNVLTGNGKFQESLHGVTSAFGGMLGPLSSATASVRQMTVAMAKMAMTPLGAVITVIVLGLKAMHEWFTKSAEGQIAFAKISGYVGSIMASLGDVFVKVGKYLYHAFADAGAPMNAFAKSMITTFKTAVETVVNLISGLGNTIKGVFNADWDTFTKGLSQTWDAIKGAGQTALNALDTAWKGIQGTVKIATEGFSTIDTTDLKNAFAQMHKDAKEAGQLAQNQVYIQREISQIKEWEAKQDEKIAKAREKVYTLTGKAKLEELQRLKALQKEKFDKRIEQYKSLYEIQKRTNELHTSSLADKEKERQLNVQLLQLEAQRAAATRFTTRMEESTKRTLANEAKKGAKKSAQVSTAEGKLSELLYTQENERIKAEKTLEERIAQARIDAMEDGYAKTVSLREAQNKKEISDIEKQREAAIEAERKRQKAVYEAEQAVVKAKGGKAGVWNNEMFNKDDEAVKNINDLYDSLVKEVTTKQVSSTKKEWEDLIKDYQSYTDQKIAIDKKYKDDLAAINKAISEAEVAGEQEKVEALKRSRDELFNRTLQQKSQLAMSKLQESPMFSLAFGDLSNVSNDALNYLLENFEKFKNEFSKDPKAMKEWVDKIDKLTDEVANRNPMKALVDADKQYAAAIKDGQAAKALVEQIEQEKKSLEEEKKQIEARISLQETMIKVDKANGVDTSEREKALADARKDLFNISVKLNDNEIKYDKAQEKLGKAENDRVKALNKRQKAMDSINASIGKLSQSFRGLGNEIGGTAGKVMNVVSDVTDFVITVREAVKDIKEIDRKLTNAFDSASNAVEGVVESTEKVEGAVDGVSGAVSGVGAAVQGTSQITANSIKTVEKASVILTVISAALQVAMAIADLFGESEEERKAREEREKMMHEMTANVANYRLEVYRARLEEEKWFSSTNLLNLSDMWSINVEAVKRYKEVVRDARESMTNDIAHWEHINAWDTDAWRSQREFFKAYHESIEQLGHDFDMLVENEKGELETLSSFIKRIYGEDMFDENGLLNTSAIDAFLNDFSDRLGHDDEKVLKAINDLAKVREEWINELHNYISELYSPFADDLTDALWDFAENGTDAMKSFENSARSSIQAVGKEMIKSLINTMLFAKLKTELEGIYTQYAEMMAMAANDEERQAAIDFLRNGVANALQGFKDTTQSQLPVLQDISKQIYDTIDGIFPSSEVMESHVDVIKSAFQNLLDDPTQNIEEWGKNFRNALIKELIQNTLLGEKYKEWAEKWNEEYTKLYNSFANGEIDETSFKNGLDLLMADFNNMADSTTQRAKEMMEQLGFIFDKEELDSPFSGLRDTFLDTLTNMEDDADAFKKRLEEIMVKDLIEKQVLDAEFTINGMTFENFDAYITDWNKRYIEAVKSGNQAAIDALIEELVQARELTAQAAEELRDRLKKVTDDETFKGMSDNFVSALMDMNKTAEDWATDLGKVMADKIIKEMIVPTMIQPLLDNLQEVFNGVMDKAVTIDENGNKKYDWQSVINSEELKGEIDNISKQYPEIQSVIKQITDAFGLNTSTSYKYGGFSNLGDSILASLADSEDSIEEWARDMGKSMASQMAQAYIDSTYGERIKELNEEWQKALQDGNQEAMANIQESLEALYKAIGDDETLQGLIDKFKTIENPFKDMASTFVSSLMDMNASAEDFANSISQKLTEQMINKVITEGFQSQIDALGEEWRIALESGDSAAIERITQRLTELRGEMGDAIQPLLDAISDINTETDKTFSNMTDSWVSALMDMEGTAEDFAESVGKTMAQKIIKEMIAPVYIQPILDAMQKAYNAAVNVQGATVTSVVQTMMPYIEQIKGIYTEIQPMIEDLFGQIGITAEETADAIDEVQYALQDMKSNFVSTLMDMKGTAQDFSQDISKIIAQSFIEKFILGDAFDARMQQWQEQYESILGSGMSEEERKKQLKQLRDSIASAREDYTKQALAVQELLGITTSDTQEATMNMADKITYDQADQLLGVNIAQELILEQILSAITGKKYGISDDIISNIGDKISNPMSELLEAYPYNGQEMYGSLASSNAMQSEAVAATLMTLSDVTQVGQDNILMQVALMNSHLELIRDYSKKIQDEVLMHLGSIDSKLTHLREL